MSAELDIALPRVKSAEGFRPSVYLDTVGVQTIGYGCALQDWPEPFASAVAKIQLEQAETECASITGYLDLDPTRRSVLIEMMFNLGPTRLSGFHDLLRAIRDKDYTAAKEAMLDSKWAMQVKGRAVRLATIMETGVDPQ